MSQLIDLVDGLLLGDGSLEGSASSARLILNQTAKHYSWVQQVAQELNNFGITVSIGKTKSGTVSIRGRSYQRATGFSLRTPHSSFFGQQRTRWYPVQQKIVPADVRLTPVSIAHWYAGDGTVGCKGYHAKFCTDGFLEKDVLFLINRLRKELSWSPLHEERNRILLCRFEDRQSLVNMVQPILPKCFQHKLKLRISHVRSTIHGPLEQRLKELRLSGISYGKVAKELNLSKSGVHAACVRLGV